MTEQELKIVNRLTYLNRVADDYHIDGCVMGMKVSRFESTMEQAADLIKRLRAELEAAKYDLAHSYDACNVCAYRGGCYDEDRCAFKWRGMCAENGGKQ